MTRIAIDAISRMPGAAESLSSEQLKRLSDEQLMAAILGDHADGLAMLFDRYQRLVYSVALKIVRDPGEAEDVTQNVFLEIFRSAAQFDPGKGNFRGWILLYAYHRAINRRQQLQLRNFYDLLELDSADGQSAASSSDLPAQYSSRLVRQGLAALNARQRRVIELASFDGLTMREIANQIGESVPNVRHYYYRGLEALRKFMHSGTNPAAAARGIK